MSDVASEKILVLAPRGRDAELTCTLLRKHALDCTACETASEIVGGIRAGAGCAIVTTDVLGRELERELRELFAGQPPWSDFPIIVLTSGSRDQRAVGLDIGNLTALERPVAASTIVTAVNAALRGRRRQYAARAAIQQRDQFLAMLGHELRNPLGAIVLASEAEPDTVRSRDQLAARLQLIARQATHLTRLVDDLLDVARVTSGKVLLRSERVAIDDTIRDCIESVRSRAAARSIEVVFAAESGSVVDGDVVRLEQVVSNLLTNAVKYSPEGTSVTVATAVIGDRCEIRVRDQGIGIAAEMLPRVFELFAQADVSLERAEGGMGIGLALVDRLVRLHGGTVDVTSPGLGAGSEFVVRLPLGSSPPAPVPKRPGTYAQNGMLRVVLVEDNPDLRDLTQALLEGMGCSVDAADDGPGGLEMIVRVKPDLAVIDIGLPGMDGFVVAEETRARLRHPPMLVAVSGYGQRRDRDHALASGFDQHITKPVRGDVLRSIVETARALATPTILAHG